MCLFLNKLQAKPHHQASSVAGLPHPAICIRLCQDDMLRSHGQKVNQPFGRAKGLCPDVLYDDCYFVQFLLIECGFFYFNRVRMTRRLCTWNVPAGF
ncbi:MAG: hypothetical protein EBR09_01070 [Proteobacteria bacterium]|nr:hypothetical protein [Pseudomonadota bacterium]